MGWKIGLPLRRYRQVIFACHYGMEQHKITDRKFVRQIMNSSFDITPLGNSMPVNESVIKSTVALGVLVREQRQSLALKQLDVAGLGNTGNRFIVDLERGKPTVQLQKVLDVLDLLGLEVVVRVKAGAR